MSFIQRFRRSLESLYQLPAGASYVVAYSGGLDSQILLYCCKQLKIPVRAVHVHHGLQKVADDWVLHCQSSCDQLSIALDVFYVNALPEQGQSPEEAARKVRYQAIYNNLNDGDCLITAQHEDDQAETLLLQLFRTASAAGLSAMPACKKIGNAVHVRPLLGFSRNEILDYAEKNKLQWIEDPSNQDTVINRNFIRKEVLPIVISRWPQLTTQLSTVAALQADNLQVLEDMAAIDLADLIQHENKHYEKNYRVESCLSLSGLRCLSSARRFNLLRLWILQGANIAPGRKLLREIDKTLINTSQDAAAVVKFAGYEFRKFQQKLYLLKAVFTESPQKSYQWSPKQDLDIPSLNRKLTARRSTGKNILPEYLLSETLTVSFRRGGERFHPAGRKHSQSLKKLFQEAAIPPWERELIPLLYWQDNLLAVADIWLAKEFAVSSDSNGWLIAFL